MNPSWVRVSQGLPRPGVTVFAGALEALGRCAGCDGISVRSLTGLVEALSAL